MSLLDFIFRLGVLFAIYGFLWGLIEIVISLLRAGAQRSIPEVYLVKALKYFFLVDVTFLFCVEQLGAKTVVVDQGIMAGIILLMYFLGKLQQQQNRSRIFQMGFNSMPMMKQHFNIRAELGVISVALGAFVLFWFYPHFAYNPLSQWFHESIINIEDTPVFGFIFKIIGFFFMLSIIFKVVNAFTLILSGAAFRNQAPKEESGSDDNFDDYEEIS
jgi:hypothetical protein